MLSLATLSATHPAAADAGSSIVNGLATQDYASVGALLAGSDPDSAESWCTGTLIGCHTFLTAAHCVCGTSDSQCQPPSAPDPSHYQVFLARGGVFSVESITVRSDYAYPVGDLAVLKLSEPVAGIRPSELNTTSAPPFGSAGTIVGFGRSNGWSSDYGIERYGAVTTGACPLFVSPTTSLCWTFDASVGPAGSDSNTCNGDSGGPLFVDFGDGPRVAGVTSGGTTSSCLATDQSYDANVFTYRSWLTAQGGADLDWAVCGALPPVGDAQTETIDLPGTLSSAAPESRSSFEVLPSATLLRVAMNGIDDGIANFDLYLKHGAPPTTTSFDCARRGTGQFGVCDMPAPTPGSWHVLVRRVAGGGSYQLAATSFGRSALDIDLSSSLPGIAPGAGFPFTITLDNQTGAEQSFALIAMLLIPGGAEMTIIPGVWLSLPNGGRIAPTLELPLPPWVPTGTWTIGAALWQEGVGVLDTAALSFQVE